jgi:DNA-binding transcriptional LysR family regulator
MNVEATSLTSDQRCGTEHSIATDKTCRTLHVHGVDQLSFRAPALRPGVSASALSHSTRQVEERLGVELQKRPTRSVSLTDAGARLLYKLRPAKDQITELRPRRLDG